MIDFDSKAATWDEDPVKAERARAVADAIRARVPLAATMTALEYGCGTGLLSFALQAALGRITLADSSEGMLAVLREKLAGAGLDQLQPVVLDLSIDPLPAERYDLIYSLMTLHHIPDTDAILATFRKLLVTPGVLCIADLEREDGSFHGEGFAGHHGFDLADLAERTRRAGFAEVEFTRVFTIPKSVGGVEKQFPVFLMVARTG